MNLSFTKRILRWVGYFGGVLVLAWLVSGCKGVPTGGEKKARQDLREVTGFYRPNEQRPVLPALQEDAGLSNYLKYAILNNPQIEATYYDWAASVERITVARSFPDPKLTFQADIQDTLTSLMPGLMVDLPGPGKRHAAAAVSTAESRAKYFLFQNSALRVAFDLKVAYYRLHLLNAKLKINIQTLELLGQLEKLAQSQNDTGRATLQDVYRAQIEKERLETELENLRDSRHFLMAQFKASLGLKEESPEPPFPAQFETTSVDVDKLFATALAHNPRLKSMEAEVRQAEASILVARKARIPDFSLGLEADAKTSPALYRPLATMTLPIWRDKLTSQITEAQANKRLAEARLSSEQIQLAVDFAEKSFMVRESSRNVDLLEKRLLPKAKQSLDVSRSAYLSGKTDFLNVIDSQRTLLDFELMEVDARAEREIALSELSLVIAGLSPVKELEVRGRE